MTKLDKKADNVIATIEGGGKSQSITAERAISAVGVVGNIENLGLEKLGVKTERGIIAIDQTLSETMHEAVLDAYGRALNM